jgi:hypothetical protein
VNHIPWIGERQLHEHKILSISAQHYYTYLNSSLLKAPRECVLHGLVPSSNWAPLWSHSMRMHLVAMPDWYLAVYSNGSSFTPAPSIIFYTSSIFLGRLAGLHSLRPLQLQPLNCRGSPWNREESSWCHKSVHVQPGVVDAYPGIT